ncbi:MAG: hypothetical protein Q9180_004830, partial [Flavoplaca navasiana]
ANLINPLTRYPDANLTLPLPTNPWPHLQIDMEIPPDCGEVSYVGNGRLAGRHALITGGDSGIGRAIAIAYVREGANVTINYLPEEEPDAQDLEDFLAREGLSLVRIPGDLLNETFCEELVAEAEQSMGGLDIVVNNAGYITHAVGSEIRYVNNYTTEEFDRTLRTNLYAPFFITRAAVPLMPPGSSVVFTTSGTAVNPLPFGWDYSGSKAMVIAMATGLARQLVPMGIRVNAVAAGLTYTPFLTTEGYNTSLVLETASESPARRLEQPVEIAHVFVDIVDDALTFTTGSVWGAAGGLGL